MKLKICIKVRSFKFSSPNKSIITLNIFPHVIIFFLQDFKLEQIWNPFCTLKFDVVGKAIIVLLYLPGKHVLTFYWIMKDCKNEMVWNQLVMLVYISCVNILMYKVRVKTVNLWYSLVSLFLGVFKVQYS